MSKLIIYWIAPLMLFASMAPLHSVADDLRNPLAYSLGAQQRRSEITTDLGVFTLKWSRGSEVYFGRNPERALSDAAQTVRKAIVQSAFPVRLKSFSQPWSIVMLDESTAQRELSGSLATNCHPGWMVPPNNIYLVAERAAQYCGGKQVPVSLADQRLAQVLIHEIGHAVEFFLLAERATNDRMRAEGFAAWFEQYASQYSSIIQRGSVRADYRHMLSPSAFAPGWQFSGSGGDYARAALFFELLERKRGVAGVMELYGAHTGSFWDNYARVVGVSSAELQRQLIDLARK